MTDNRPFVNAVPLNAEVYAANLGVAGGQPDYSEGNFVQYSEPFAEAVPVHPFEERNVEAIRGYVVNAGEKQFKIYRGDMHRHTDVSQDFKYDGSLIEVYRYALDAAAFDYIVPTDHQLGYDQEFTWWQDEKLADLFHVPGSFVPMFGYERSLKLSERAPQYHLRQARHADSTHSRRRAARRGTRREAVCLSARERRHLDATQFRHGAGHRLV